MRHRFTVLACFVLAAAPALAQQRPTFSVDFQGPMAGLLDGCAAVPITEGDILTTTPPGPPGPNAALLGPLPPPCVMVGGPPGAPGTFPGGLGILPGAAGLIELDALSYGRDDGDQLYFSVDDFATGIPTGAPDVFSEGIAGSTEASADVFVYAGAVAPTPPGPTFGNSLWNDGNGLAPPLPAKRGYGLIEPNPPTPGALPDPGDNLDAVDLDTRLTDFPGPIYFSVDGPFPDFVEPFPVNAGTNLGNGVSGGDVLVTFAGAAPLVSCPALTLGLDLFGPLTDDLDALAFNDVNGDTLCTPGVDALYFSVRRASAVIGAPDSCFGVPIEEGDILTFPAGPIGTPPCLFIAAEALGLGTIRSGTNGPFGADELDALDILPPHVVPATPFWLLAPLAALVLATGLWMLPHRRRDTA